MWIVPTAKFQWDQYSKRDWIHNVLAECKEPEVTFQNWMNRDIEFATIIANDAQNKGLKTLVVDEAVTLDENIAIIEEYFRLRELYTI